jgi:hypothetical protein
MVLDDGLEDAFDALTVLAEINKASSTECNSILDFIKGDSGMALGRSILLMTGTMVRSISTAR